MPDLIAGPSFAGLFPLNGFIAPTTGPNEQGSLGSPDGVQPLNGITSGPGNQGTRNTANLVGHAGTPASRLGVPLSLKAGGTTVGISP